ncbi:MAG: glycogen synthase GlgA [Verrucomicrobia bacterium]|nr:glycogen synthase GlgA [Verrucomicrobiota bacterium]
MNLRILLASSELFPYSKTGGLADMVAALAKSLARSGQRVGVVTPLYAGLPRKFPEIQRANLHLALPLGPETVTAEVWSTSPAERLTVYFIDQPAFYQRACLYVENGVEYADNAERFVFLSKCVARLAQELPWQPQILHVHDWHVALSALFVRSERDRAGQGSHAPATCLTIHNVAFQGSYPAQKYALTNLPWDYFTPDGAEFYGRLNALKAGICHADFVTTVSPRYAREITTETFGCGLDAVLRARQAKLVGILNGVDYDEWDPERDACLPQRFSSADLTGKAANKAALQKELGLPVVASTPLFGTISRLTDQKGMDIELAALEEMLPAGFQFVLLGSGASDFEQAYQVLARRYPRQVAARTGYDHPLAHRIEGGCDFYLMPSKFEPCGLNQMYSLRYGTIPVVRATGGLDDSVVDIVEDRGRANGIKFQEFSAGALAKAIRKALVLYAEPGLLDWYRRNAMAVDCSWGRSTERYAAVYRRLAGR